MSERLEVIRGCMFAGKTHELIRRADRAEHSKWPYQIFKPNIDKRWGAITTIRTHNGVEADAIPVGDAHHLWELVLPETKLVAIEEIQFFDPGIVEVIDDLLHRDIRVVVAGLSADFRNRAFGPMGEVTSMADHIVTLFAICKVEVEGQQCNVDATRTQRLIKGQPANFNDPIILIGGDELYEARCSAHHEVPGRQYY